MNVFGVYIYEGHSNACLYNINKCCTIFVEFFVYVSYFLSLYEPLMNRHKRRSFYDLSKMRQADPGHFPILQQLWIVLSTAERRRSVCASVASAGAVSAAAGVSAADSHYAVDCD